MIYYNENDAKAAEWLRVLSMIDAINPGTVDDRDIQDVTAADLRGMDQCHFFAGIGGWSYALDLAGWPRTRPVWTASLPCQPFSDAGGKRGQADERHLWPHFRDLIEQGLPPVIIGEQVSSKLAIGESTYVTKTKSIERLLEETGSGADTEPEWAWFATVQADLEDLGYVVGAIDLPAAGVGAPHIRHRLYWCAYRADRLADDDSERLPQWTESDRQTKQPGLQTPHGDNSMRCGSGLSCGLAQRHHGSEHPGAGCGLADSKARRRGQINQVAGGINERGGAEGRERLEHSGGLSRGLVDTDDQGRQGPSPAAQGEPPERFSWFGRAGRADQWGNVIYIPCADGKARPIKPGVEPLVDGVSPGLGLGWDYSEPYSVGDFNSNEARVARLRGYGNAIVPQCGALFVQSVMDIIDT